MCVALSRARHGMYVIGNLKMMSGTDSSRKYWGAMQMMIDISVL